MYIPNVGNQGPVDRSADRSADRKQATAALPPVVIPAKERDLAEISERGRETAAAVEGLAERARRVGSEREEVVAAAREKLLAGGLDDAAVLAATAERLAGSDLLSA
jgi:hypothetical protein